jgi:hypothetical protein
MSELVSLATAVAEVRSRHRPLIDEAEHWAVEHGAPGDADLFALVRAGHADRTSGDPTQGRPRAGVYRLVRIAIPNWCTLAGCRWPLEVVPATWHWLDFLHDTRRTDPGDPLFSPQSPAGLKQRSPRGRFGAGAGRAVWELRKPLICYGGLRFDGRPRPGDDPSPIPCECFLPYRVSVEYLNRELPRAERGGNPPAWETPDPARRGFRPATLGRRWTIDPPPLPRRGRSGPGTTRRRRPATKKR